MAAIPAPIKDEGLAHGELDLYAGVDEFGNAANAGEGPEGFGADLYEDVLTNQDVSKDLQSFPDEAVLLGGKEYKSYTTIHPKSAIQQEKEAKIAASLYSKGAEKGKALYVGNLSWWTTDEELSGAIEGCGVTDLINIKFFENRVNGQSKGFAVVEVGSETSQRLIMERLDKQELHGQKPAVTHVSKQNLMMFENQAKKSRPGEQSTQDQNAAQAALQPRGNNFVPGVRLPPRLPHPPRMPQMGIRPGIPGNLSQQFGGMPAGMQRPPMGLPAFDARGQPLRPPMMHGMIPGMLPNMGMPGMPGGPRLQPPVDPMMAAASASLPQVMGTPNIPSSAPQERPDLNGMQQLAKPGIAPHVNPAFLPQDPSHVDPFGSVAGGNPLAMRMPNPMGAGSGGVQDADIDSMRRNQAVASTAIQRAMTDANEGDYESGIETLVTAISLIKQSSTANTESSQVLVQSLQDCLHSLEAQLMTRGKDDRDRDDRVRSPYDDYRSSDRSRYRSRRHRSRSRSKDRSRRRSYSPRDSNRSRSREKRRR
eukprot:gene18169-19982_t